MLQNLFREAQRLLLAYAAGAAAIIMSSELLTGTTEAIPFAAMDLVLLALVEVGYLVARLARARRWLALAIPIAACVFIEGWLVLYGWSLGASDESSEIIVLLSKCFPCGAFVCFLVLGTARKRRDTRGFDVIVPHDYARSAETQDNKTHPTGKDE